MIKNCLSTKKTMVIIWNVRSNRDFCANGISLRVETRVALLDENYLADKTIKFSLTGKMPLSCPLGSSRCVSQEKISSKP